MSSESDGYDGRDCSGSTTLIRVEIDGILDDTDAEVYFTFRAIYMSRRAKGKDITRFGRALVGATGVEILDPPGLACDELLESELSFLISESGIFDRVTDGFTCWGDE